MGTVRAAITTFAAALGGCQNDVRVVVDDGRGRRGDVVIVEPGPPIYPGPPVVILPAEDPATLAEIRAASRLAFESGRTEALGRIAARPDLGIEAQLQLVDAAMRSLAFESGRVEVLETLIRNPAFAAPARTHLIGQIHRLTFESSKQSLLAELDRPYR